MLYQWAQGDGRNARKDNVEWILGVGSRRPERSFEFLHQRLWQRGGKKGVLTKIPNLKDILTWN